VRVVDAALAAAGGAPIQWQELPLGAAAIETHGSAIPEVTLEALAGLDGWLLGPHDSARLPRAVPEPAQPERHAAQALRPVRQRAARRAPSRADGRSPRTPTW
jgi:3-isopropylmalate dehydrogenase